MLKPDEKFDMDTMTVVKKTDETVIEKKDEGKPDEKVDEKEEVVVVESKTDATDPEKKDDPEKQDDEPEEKVVEGDDFIKSILGEEFEINSQEELLNTLQAAEELAEENETLKAQLKEKGDEKPKFESEEQEKLFNFIIDIGYDSSRYAEGVQSYATVMTIDPKAADARIVMEEKFILDKPELTRDEAKHKFNKYYEKNFGTLNRDNFDTEAEFEEAQKDRKIDLKEAEAKARKVIAEKQKEFKAKPNTKEEKKEPEINEVVTKGIERTADEFNEYFDDFKQLVFSPEEDEESDFSFDFNKEQLQAIRTLCLQQVKTPSLYNQKGQLAKDSDPELWAKRAAYLLYGDEITAQLYEHAKTVTAAKRVEELGEKKPNRVSKTGDASKVALTEDEQIQRLIEQKKNKKPVTA